MNRTKKYTLLLLATFALVACSGGPADTDSNDTQRAWRVGGPGSISGSQGGGGGGGDQMVVTFAHPTQANGPSPDPWHTRSPSEGPSPDPWNPAHPDQADPPSQPGTPNNGGGGNGGGDDD